MLLHVCLSAASRVRVLLVTITLGLGGSERQLALLAQELYRRHIDVRVFALDAEGPWLERLRTCGVPVIAGRFGGGGGIRAVRVLRLTRSAMRLAGTILWFRPAVVHAYLPLANFVAAVVGSTFRVPRVLISRRGLGTYRDSGPNWNRLDRLAYRLSDFTICNSKAVLEDSVRRDNLGREKYRVIYNGIESNELGPATSQRRRIRNQLRLESEDIVLVKVANLIPYKGHEELLTAFQLVIRAYPAARLVLAGEDRDNWKQQLEHLVDKLGIREKVLFFGRCENIPALLEAMDVAVVSSREEGFSNALLEALEAGLPVVATDVGGNREALEDGRFGLLVPSRNPTALAGGINTMISSLAYWREVAGEARKMVRERFSIEAMVDAHLQLYGCAPRSSTPPADARRTH